MMETFQGQALVGEPKGSLPSPFHNPATISCLDNIDIADAKTYHTHQRLLHWVRPVAGSLLVFPDFHVFPTTALLTANE
jgi:hypothetical protein